MTENIEFETHITVALNASDEWTSFACFCAQHDFKCVHIALETGQTPSQPMLTFHGRSDLGVAMVRALRTRHDCQNAGFEVTRVKLEVAPENCEIGGVTSNSPKYFEHHIKLLLPANADISLIQNAIVPHEARLSRNARRERADGQFERFVTQRCSAVAAVEADSRFESLLAILNDLPFPILETEREFVVFDSNLALDNGWFDRPIHQFKSTW